MIAPMMLMLVQEGGELPAPFRLNPGLTIWTFIVFFALLFALSKFAYPLMVKAVAEREERLKRLSAEAQAARDQAAGLLEEHRAILASATGEASAILAEARAAADRERHLAVERTRAEQNDVLAQAKREIQSEREQAIAEIRKEAVDLAIAAAGKVVGQRLDAAADRKLVEDYISTLGKGV